MVSASTCSCIFMWKSSASKWRKNWKSNYAFTKNQSVTGWGVSLIVLWWLYDESVPHVKMIDLSFLPLLFILKVCINCIHVVLLCRFTMYFVMYDLGCIHSGVHHYYFLTCSWHWIKLDCHAEINATEALRVIPLQPRNVLNLI